MRRTPEQMTHVGGVRLRPLRAVGTHVLREDPDLAAAVPEAQRGAAERASLAALVYADRGPWDAGPAGDMARSGHGLLVLDGLLVREVSFRNHAGAEVLGPGDVLRPRDEDESALGIEASWRVLLDVRLAVLDHSWSYRMAAFPEVAITLTARAMQRSRRLASAIAITQCRQLDDRLHLVLWDLADRFGRVGLDGVHLELPMTHDILSHIAGAQRPSVSSALSRLSRAGRVKRTDRGWLLQGEPPAELTWGTSGASVAAG
jgi:CRP/FNR family cyclic AMP-dependent transcriptional regulator